MIRSVDAAGGIGLSAELTAGQSAFVDADWVPREPGAPVPAVLVDADGTMWWADAVSAPSPLGKVADGEAAAAAILDGIAADAVVAAGDSDDVFVNGSGRVASSVRRRLPARLAAAASGALVVVETTGDPESIRDATRSVADLATVVLCGEPSGRKLSLNLYPDVHVRGLVLVGVPGPASRRPQETSAAGAEAGAALVASGSPLPDAEWYRLSG